MEILATDVVRFRRADRAGDRGIGGVLAAGCQAVEIDYEPIPGVFDPEEASPRTLRSFTIRAISSPRTIDRGDVESAFSGAAATVEGEYRTQFVDHAYLSRRPRGSTTTGS